MRCLVRIGSGMCSVGKIIPPTRPNWSSLARIPVRWYWLPCRRGRLDTVTQLRQRPRRVELLRGSDGKTRGRQVSPSEPNAQEEIAHLFGDGWISVVRLEPLRPLPVDAREKKAIETRRAQSREEFRKLAVGAREDIIGFGPRSVYIAFKDNDDIQRLRRHPWP